MRQMAVLVALLALSVRAEVGVSSPVAAPKWSVGAGVGFFESLTVFSSGGLLGGVGVVPTPRFTVERFVNERTALTAAVSLNASSTTAPLNVQLSTFGAALGGGVRRIVTAVDAPIAVSVLGAATVGYSSSVNNGLSSRAFFVGVTGAVAFERVLLGNLSLRVQLQLVRASIGRSFVDRYEPLSISPSAQTNYDLSLVPAPSLELRLVF